MTRLLFCLFSLAIGNMIMAQSITSVQPNSASRGQQLSVSISGQATNFGQGTNTTVAWFSQGSSTVILPDLVEVTASDSIEAQFSIASNANLGLYDVHVNSYVDGHLVLPDGFQVLTDPTPPSLMSVDPDSAMRGQTLAVSISGQHTNFGQGTQTTEVWFSQGTSTMIYPDFSNDVSVDSIEAQFSIPTSVPTGSYDVNTSNYLDGDLMLANSFYIGKDTTGSGIAQAEKQPFEVYPNPFTNHVKLDLNTQKLSKLNIALVDVQGRLVKSFPIINYQVSSGKFYLDMSDLKGTTGAYFLKVQLDDRTYLKKLIKK